MKQRHLKSLWLGLLREIKLGEKPEDGRRTSFMAGSGGGVLWGVCVDWWRTAEGDRRATLLALTYIESVHDRSHHELDHVRSIVFKVLQEQSVNPEIFRSILFAKNGCLFDRIVCGHEDVARLLDSNMRRLMNEETGSWIFIHPLYRVFAKLGGFEFQSLSIVDPGDMDFWSFEDGKRLLGGWDPRTGCFKDGRGIGFRRETHHSFLVGKYEGSKQGVKERFKADGQQMMAAAYAFWRRERVRHKVKAVPDEGVLAFHSTLNGYGSYEFSELGQIYPCYGDEMHLESFASELLGWNSLRGRLAPEARSRINTALRFINLAMCSKDISVYINYFIAIDALFGEYRKVESGILAGVQDVCSLPAAREKIVWLFDLRNEIVHGGSRSVHEWARYPRYLKHFESDPVRDIEEISLDCIRNFCRN